MPATACRAFQHPQSYLVLLLHNEPLDTLRVRLVIAVHIVKEIAAYALATSQRTIHVTYVIRQLQQFLLLLLITPLSLSQMSHVLSRITQSHQLLAVLYGEGKLALALVIDLVYHNCSNCQFSIVKFFITFCAMALAWRTSSLGSSSTSCSGRENTK